jgi:hypothetical protein
MRRRRKGVLLLAFVVAAFFLVNWLMNLFGGGSTPVETDRGTVQPEPERDPPTEIDPPPDAVKPEVPSIEGFVRDDEGNGIEGASVLIVTIDDGVRGEIELETDADGRFVEESPRRGDVVFVEVLRPGYPPLRRRYEDTSLRPGETFRPELTMAATFDLSGHVKSMAGPPIVGAKVRFGDWLTTTEDRGRFRLTGIDAEVLRREPRPKLVVTHGDHRTEELELVLEGKRANLRDIQVVLEPR